MWAAKKERCHRPLLLLLYSFLPLSSLSPSLYHLCHEELGTARAVNAKQGLFYLYCMCAFACVSVSLLRKDDVYMYVSCLPSVLTPSQFATALVKFVTTHPGIDDASCKLAILFPPLSDT